MLTRTLPLALALLLAAAAPAMAQSRQPASVWRDVLGRGGARVDDGDSDRDSDRDSDGGGFWGDADSDRDSDSDSDGGAWSRGSDRGGWDVWGPDRRPAPSSRRGSVRDVILGRSLDGDLARAHEAWHRRYGRASADPAWRRAHEALDRSIDREMRLRASGGGRAGLPDLLSQLIFGGR